MIAVLAVLCVFLIDSGNPEEPSVAPVVSRSIEIRNAAGFGGDGNLSSTGGEDENPGFIDQYTITELNTWSIPAGNQALGLDYIDLWYEDDIVAYVSNLDNKIYWMNANTGCTVYPEWDTAEFNTIPFGVAHIPLIGDDEIHVNDRSFDGIFYRECDTIWDSYNALCDNMGRGMDYYLTDDKIFEFYTTGSPGSYSHFVAIYTPGSSTGPSYKLNCVANSWRGSGCTLFPKWEGGIGIAVTLYESSLIRFFEYPGNPGGMYYGCGVLPYSESMYRSYGLAYSDELGTFFHSWMANSGDYFISELDIVGVSLESSTWAGIKSRF